MRDVKSRESIVPAGIAVTASAGAVACGVCCILPFALPAAMLGSLGGVLAFFDQAYPWMRIAAVVAVLAGWCWVVVQSIRKRLRPATSTVLVMMFATAVMSVALLWGKFEEPLIRLVS